MKNIITVTDCNGYGQKRVEAAIKEGYKISSTHTSYDKSEGTYTVITMVRKNWLERLFKL